MVVVVITGLLPNVRLGISLLQLDTFPVLQISSLAMRQTPKGADCCSEMLGWPQRDIIQRPTDAAGLRHPAWHRHKFFSQGNPPACSLLLTGHDY